MGIVNRNNIGFLINIDFNHSEETIEWAGCCSTQLYDILIKYGIVKPSPKHIFINDPDSIRFEKPQQEYMKSKPRIITTYRERDLNKYYIKVDPNITPVYVQVDPNSPAVYIAVDQNMADFYLKEIIHGIDKMIENSAELIAQNKRLINNLDICLKKLEAENNMQLKNEPNAIYWNASEANLPYIVPQIESLPHTADIAKLTATINLNSLALNMNIYGTRESIMSFQKRLDKIMIPQDKQE
jgi:hypothetical protein